MAHVREVARKPGPKYPHGVAYEVMWRDGEKKLQRTFPVKRDAERFALKVENAKNVGDTTRSLAGKAPTVAQVIAASMEAAEPKLKPRTFHSYERLYASRVLPRFGARKVTTVTRADVQAWINSLAGEGLAPATVHHCYVALRKAMKHAVWDRQIAHNPCDGIDLPKSHQVDEAELAALTYAQVEAVSAELAGQGPYDLMVRFMAYTGLRAGEVAGLRVRDVDLAAGHISVRQTAQHINGGWVLGTPKSRRSTRDVPLLDLALIAQPRGYKMRHPRSGDPDALFWPGRTPGVAPHGLRAGVGPR